MKKADLLQFQRQLLALRARLTNDVSQLAGEALHENGASTMPIHMADVGTDAFEKEFTLTLMENEEEVLNQIAHALNRMGNGTFGTCETCREPIARERLEAIPYVAHCVRCARKLEEK